MRTFLRRYLDAIVETLTINADIMKQYFLVPYCLSVANT